MQQKPCLKHVSPSLSAMHMPSSAHPASVLPSLTPIKDFARAKAVTSAAWNKAARPPLRANFQMNPGEFCEITIKIVPVGRPPIPAHFASCTGRALSKLEKGVVSMLALVGGLKDLWTVGRHWCGQKNGPGECVCTRRGTQSTGKKGQNSLFSVAAWVFHKKVVFTGDLMQLSKAL